MTSASDSPRSFLILSNETSSAHAMRIISLMNASVYSCFMLSSLAWRSTARHQPPELSRWCSYWLNPTKIQSLHGWQDFPFPLPMTSAKRAAMVALDSGYSRKWNKLQSFPRVLMHFGNIKLSRCTLNIDLKQADQEQESYDSQTGSPEKRKGKILKFILHNSLLKFFHPNLLAWLEG